MLIYFIKNEETYSEDEKKTFINKFDFKNEFVKITNIDNLDKEPISLSYLIDDEHYEFDEEFLKF